MTVPDTCTTDSTGASHKTFFTEAADCRERGEDNSKKHMNLKESVREGVGGGGRGHKGDKWEWGKYNKKINY